MKISLRQEEQCSVLDVQGDIDSHNFNVLKAGLTKLLQNGKNRIILHVQDGDKLSTDVIRELAILDVFARELSGKIVIASGDPDLKAKVTSFANPPVVAILPSVAKSLEYLKDLDSIEGDEAGESFFEIQTQLEAKIKQVAALEAQLKLASVDEAQALRAENATLKDKVALLEGQVAEIAGKRRAPVTAEGMTEKIEALEETVRRLSVEKQAGAKK